MDILDEHVRALQRRRPLGRLRADARERSPTTRRWRSRAFPSGRSSGGTRSREAYREQPPDDELDVLDVRARRRHVRRGLRVAARAGEAGGRAAPDRRRRRGSRGSSSPSTEEGPPERPFLVSVRTSSRSRRRRSRRFRRCSCPSSGSGPVRGKFPSSMMSPSRMSSPFPPLSVSLPKLPTTKSFPFSPLTRVVAGAAEQLVIAGTARDRVRPQSGGEVVPVAAVEGVVSVRCLRPGVTRSPLKSPPTRPSSPFRRRSCRSPGRRR